MDLNPPQVVEILKYDHPSMVHWIEYIEKAMEEQNVLRKKVVDIPLTGKNGMMHSPRGYPGRNDFIFYRKRVLTENPQGNVRTHKNFKK